MPRRSVSALAPAAGSHEALWEASDLRDPCEIHHLRPPPTSGPLRRKLPRGELLTRGRGSATPQFLTAASESDLRGRCVSPPRFRDLRRSASTTRAWTAFAPESAAGVKERTTRACGTAFALSLLARGERGTELSDAGMIGPPLAVSVTRDATQDRGRARCACVPEGGQGGEAQRRGVGAAARGRRPIAQRVADESLATLGEAIDRGDHPEVVLELGERHQRVEREPPHRIGRSSPARPRRHRSPPSRRRRRRARAERRPRFSASSASRRAPSRGARRRSTRLRIGDLQVEPVAPGLGRSAARVGRLDAELHRDQLARAALELPRSSCISARPRKPIRHARARKPSGRAVVDD